MLKKILIVVMLSCCSIASADSLKYKQPKVETDPLSMHLDQTAPQTITGGIPIFAAGIQSDAWYSGDASPDGTWRIIQVGNNLAFQQKQSGVYVTRHEITPDGMFRLGKYD